MHAYCGTLILAQANMISNQMCIELIFECIFRDASIHLVVLAPNRAAHNTTYISILNPHQRIHHQ